ncbi:hypothetical protein ACWDUI_32720 [Streptosporangium sandarakinum]|uniref:hypothetical protein n=1 Tax=Streptosporangium sandarakinum TaxID=1260955 RepID=UPI00369C7FFB
MTFRAVPGHCHPSVRGTGADDGPSVDYARLWVTEHGDEASAVVVLDRDQITELRDTLTRWLDSRDPVR